VSRRPERPPRTAAEWWTFGVAVALVAAVAAVILASWAVGDRGPADVRAGAAGPAERVGDAWRVPFEVRNRGGRAATSVQVTAELRIDGTVVGEGEQSFDFLSGGERESGAFLFPEDPEKGELSIAVASYADP
jgi:uncharacterized protein (TIGR02588 family)